MNSDKRTRDITLAAGIGLMGNAILAAGKLTTGIFSGSLAVIADGVDSSTDVLISIVTLIAARIMAKPSDAEHPFGHGRAETMATTVLAFVVFFAGTQLAMNALEQLLSGAVRTLPGQAALWVTGISIAGKLLLAWNQFSVGKKTGSTMLLANGKNMRNDVLTSVTVLLGLAATYLFALPIIDTILSLLVSFFVIRTAVGIFMDVNRELMDGNKDQALYQDLFTAVRSVEGAKNPHRARIRWMASRLAVDVDVEVDGNLSVSEGHRIAMAVELAIRHYLPEVYDVMVHIEPLGHHEADEKFGLSEDSFADGA